MEKNTRATSIIEAMIVLMIVVSGITGVYTLMSSSQNLVTATENRIEAIQIARDGIEALTNIRDTNWLMFGADRDNCWNVLNYNTACVGDSSSGRNDYDIVHGASQGIRISKDPNNRFFIGIQNHSGNNFFTDTGYIGLFQVYKDPRGFYTQATGSAFSPIFTREINIEYLTPTGSVGNSNDARMKVTVIIQWQDAGNTEVKRLEMDTILTNWKQ